MELNDGLAGYADAPVRERLRPLYLGAAGSLAAQAIAGAEQRRGNLRRDDIFDDGHGSDC